MLHSKLKQPLAVGVIVAGAIGAILVPGLLMPRIEAHRQSQLGATELAGQIYSNDPKVGDSFPEIARLFPSVVSNTSTKPILVVYAGSCTGCSVNSVSPSMISWQRYQAAIFIFRSRPSGAEWKPQPKVAIMIDEGSVMQDRLNAVWEPRFYVLSARGSLLAIQDQHQSEVNFGVIRS